MYDRDGGGAEKTQCALGICQEKRCSFIQAASIYDIERTYISAREVRACAFTERI